MATMAWNPYVPDKPVLEADDFARVLTPGWIEIALGIATLVIYGMTGAYEDMMIVGNILGPIVLSMSVAWGAYRILRNSIRCLWVPLFWYRVSMFTYYGLGSLVPLFVNAETRETIMDFYSFFPRDMLKLNIVIVVFHLIVLVGARMILGGLSSRATAQRARARMVKLISPANFGVGVCGAVFLIIGAAANVVIILPATLGWYSSSAFGPLYNLALASLLGYFLLTYWALNNKKLWVLGVVFFFAALETVLGLLQMTKFISLFPTVMIGLAFIYHRPTLVRLTSFGVILFTTFIFMTPLISYARNVNATYYQSAASPAEVLQIYSSYNGRDIDTDPYANVQGGWARLSYVNAGTFAVNQYDANLPGDSYRYAVIVWIPRIIYPNKPNITDVSREFTYAVNGNYDSSSSAGLPAEGYYNLGWAGTILAGLIVCLAVTFWSIYSYTALKRDAWHLFFVVLMGMRMGTRMDGALVADIIGPIGICLISHVILEFLNRFLPQRVGERWTLPESAGEPVPAG